MRRKYIYRTDLIVKLFESEDHNHDLDMLKVALQRNIQISFGTSDISITGYIPDSSYLELIEFSTEDEEE